jgi:citrate synthase
MEPWRTAVTEANGERLAIRGHDVAELIGEATFAEVAGLLVSGRRPSAVHARILNAILIAIADHGAGAPSAAAARMVATGNRQAPEAAIAAGILAIGDAHAGAGHACMQLIADGLGRVRREAASTVSVAEKLVDEARHAGRRLPGFGHRLYQEDPRTTALLALAAETGTAGAGVAFAKVLEEVIGARIKPLPLNVDGAIAALLHDLGYPPVTAKLFFIIGRSAGLAAQVLEEYTRERAMRIRIPVHYDGPDSPAA